MVCSITLLYSSTCYSLLLLFFVLEAFKFKYDILLLLSFPYLNDFIISFQKSFILPKHHVLAVMKLFLFCVILFLSKKDHFQQKQQVSETASLYHKLISTVTSKWGRSTISGKNPSSCFSYFETFHSRFWRNKIKFLFNSQNLLSSTDQCMWLHLCFLFGKFHIDIHNKMADNNGTDLLYETDFDITKDGFCWTDIFIKWFEDYQLLYQFVRLQLLKVEICSACKSNYLQT